MFQPSDKVKFCGAKRTMDVLRLQQPRWYSKRAMGHIPVPENNLSGKWFRGWCAIELEIVSMTIDYSNCNSRLSPFWRTCCQSYFVPFCQKKFSPSRNMPKPASETGVGQMWRTPAAVGRWPTTCWRVCWTWTLWEGDVQTVSTEEGIATGDPRLAPPDLGVGANGAAM